MLIACIPSPVTVIPFGQRVPPMSQRTSRPGRSRSVARSPDGLPVAGDTSSGSRRRTGDARSCSLVSLAGSREKCSTAWTQKRKAGLDARLLEAIGGDHACARPERAARNDRVGPLIAAGRTVVIRPGPTFRSAVTMTEIFPSRVTCSRISLPDPSSFVQSSPASTQLRTQHGRNVFAYH
jgi:hypothetical protein